MTAMQQPQPLSLALFELAAELHRSGSGAVFEATDVRSGGRVAIKRKDSSELGERKLLEHEAVLLATLSQAGLLDRTLIVITSDHGEAFRERGLEGRRGLHIR